MIQTNFALIIAVSAVRMLTGLAIVKMLSFAYGPVDFGVISHVMAIASLFSIIAGGGTGTGLILNLGRTPDDDERARWLAAALEIALAAAFCLGLFAVALYAIGGRAVLGDRVTPSMMLVIGAVQALTGLGNILSSYAAGVQNIRAFAAINIAAATLSAALVIATALSGNLHVTLWAAILAQGLVTLVALPVLLTPLRQSLRHCFANQRERRSPLLNAAGYALLCVAMLPVAAWLIRTDFAKRVGWDAVGQWQAVARLSDAYMQVFGVLVINFVFPRLVAARSRGTQMTELTRMSLSLLALFLVGATVLTLARSHVVALAYSPAFLPAVVQIPFQLVGDMAKVGIWLLTYNVMASGRLWVQPAAECGQALVFVGAYFMLVPWYAMMAPVYAHVCACLVLLAALSITLWTWRP